MERHRPVTESNSLSPDAQALAEASTEGFLFLNPELYVEFANSAAGVLLGTEKAGLTGRRIHDLFRNFEAGSVECAPRRDSYLVRTGVHPDRYSYRTTRLQGGVAVWLRAAIESVGDDFLSAAISHALIGGAPIGIVATDAQGLVSVWNPAAERILGYRPETAFGKPPPFPFPSGEFSSERECRATRADGRELEILCSVAPFQAAGAGLGQVAMFLDITERNRMRREMESAEKWESLGILAGGVAHDFNNLLTAILGNASLGLYSVDEHHEVRAYLEDILRAGERAAALTRQLLAYSGRGRFVATRMDLGDFVRDVTALAEPILRSKGVGLNVSLQPGLAPIEGDPNQLQQVLMNLLMNGAEAFDGRDPGKISVDVRVQQISGSLPPPWSGAEPLPPGRYALLKITDTGVGMDADTRARIFEPFFSTKFTGRGLGLPVVLGIVRQHRGVVAAESALGEGSTFHVLLPVMEEMAAVSPISSDDADADSAGLILLVDDEETVRQIARRSLEHWRYQVAMAENGQAAIEILRGLGPRLRAVILDLTMPVMGGEEALGHIRRLRPDVPVILTSGYSEAVAMRQMGGIGVAAFLQKPFTTEQLGSTLTKVLGARRRDRRENAESDGSLEILSDR